MKLHQLRGLLTVHDTGSIRTAARILNVSQPALSKAISDLEIELGVSLLTRSSSGATITGWGRSILERCRTIDTEIQSIREDASLLRENWAGRLRVGISSVVAGPEVVSAIAALRERCPGIQLSVFELRPHDIAEYVRDGILDLGITVTLGDDLPSLLQSKKVCSISHTLAGGVGHNIDHWLNHLSDLKGKSWINFSQNDREGYLLKDIFNNLDIPLPEDVVHCSSPNVALNLIVQHGFLCFWPTRALKQIRDRPGAKQIREVRLCHPLPHLSIWFIYRNSDLLSDPARKFMAEISKTGF